MNGQYSFMCNSRAIEILSQNLGSYAATQDMVVQQAGSSPRSLWPQTARHFTRILRMTRDIHKVYVHILYDIINMLTFMYTYVSNIYIYIQICTYVFIYKYAYLQHGLSSFLWSGPSTSMASSSEPPGSCWLMMLLIVCKATIMG